MEQYNAVGNVCPDKVSADGSIIAEGKRDIRTGTITELIKASLLNIFGIDLPTFSKKDTHF